MDKKELHQHLANIYLGVSPQKKKKPSLKHFPNIFRNRLFVSITIVIIFMLALLVLNKKESIFMPSSENKPISSELALVLQPNVVKINFNFEPAKEEIYSINLNNLDLVGFKTLGFSVRKANFKDNIILRVEFANAFNEKSTVYINSIPAYQWQDYRIKLTDFKNINKWSRMLNLSFIIEEWTTKERSGLVYLDNIRFLR